MKVTVIVSSSSLSKSNSSSSSTSIVHSLDLVLYNPHSRTILSISSLPLFSTVISTSTLSNANHSSSSPYPSVTSNPSTITFNSPLLSADSQKSDFLKSTVSVAEDETVPVAPRVTVYVLVKSKSNPLSTT